MNSPLQTLTMLGLLGAANSASAENLEEDVTKETSCEGTDLSSLQAAWDTEGKHYEIGEGEVCIDGARHDWRVSIVEVSDNENFPTNERIVVQVARDLEEPTDFSNIHFMGWGEPTAMLEGDYLVEAMDVMHNSGWENPAYLGLNTAGRGTEAYANSDRLSSILMREEWDDARELIVKLHELGIIAKDAVFNGHSMGGMVSVAAASQLADLDGYNVRSIAYWMPASDQTLHTFRPKFIAAVSGQILPAIPRIVAGRRGLELDKEYYDKTMFADGSNFDANFDRSLPDSARRFISCTLNLGPKIHTELGSDALTNTQHFIIEGENDPLMPSSIYTSWAELLDGYNLDVHSMTAWGVSHAIPVNASEQQKRVLHTIIDRIVPEADDVDAANDLTSE